MRLKFILLTALMLSACGETPAPIPAPPPSQQILTDCKAPHKTNLESGATQRMRLAMAQINTCLEGKIMDLTAQNMTMAESVRVIEDSLSLFRSGYQRLYFEIYNNSTRCAPSCGSNNQLQHLLAYQLELIKILDLLLTEPENTEESA